jgi:uncharacterized secreted protein with C-terminal beta-propeller domain
MLLSLTACSLPSDEPGDKPGDEEIGYEQGDTARAAEDYSEIFRMIKAVNDAQFGDRDDTAEANRAMTISEEEVGGVNDEFAFADFSASTSSVERAARGGGGDSGADFSDTNNQVEGVQESDIVKTDGKHIFVANQGHWNHFGEEIKGKVSIVRPDNGNMEIAAQITLENASPNEMLLYDGKLIIIWNQYEYIDMPSPRAIPFPEVEAPVEEFAAVATAAVQETDDEGNIVLTPIEDHEVSIDDIDIIITDSRWYGSYAKQETVVQVFDLDGDFSTPEVTYSQDGYFTSSRMIDSNIYLITTFFPPITDGFEEDELEYYIPSFAENGARRFVPARRIILPEKLDWVHYTVIGGLDVNNPDISVSIFSNLGSSGTIYSSLNNIYITRGVEDRIEELDELLGERNNWYTQSYTVIDKFSLDSGQVDFIASGKVKGYANNQFHFDEHNGILRVVTEVWGLSEDFDFSGMPVRPEEPTPPDFGDNWQEWDKWYTNVWQGWYNENREQLDKWNNWWWSVDAWGVQGGSLYTLDEDMNILAEIHGIAVGENVQSVRFMGDVGYVVTFLQVDPLFSFDLSDPRNPVQLDELKIPGFSRYMHPWADGLLLGMGVDAEEDEDAHNFGMRTGLKLSMFDVSDLENLIERHVYVIANQSEFLWSHSPVEWEHKAALVSPERNIIGFPYSYNDWGNGLHNTAYAVFAYDDNGFTLVGEILINISDGIAWEFNRGLYIDDYLYAIAGNMIVSARLDGEGLTEVQRLALL